MSPLVSIIVPNYNHEFFLKERLDSIFDQCFQDYEVILLDDASTDGSVGVLNLYKDHPKVSQLVVNQENSGSPFKQWQKGIGLAKGDYVWVAESDDYCEPGFLEQLVEKLDDKVGVCYSQTIDMDEGGEELLHRIVYTKEFDPNIWESDFQMTGLEFIEKYFLVKNVVPNASAVLFRRALVQEATFSEDLLKMRMCGDWFFWIKLCEKADVAFVAEPLNYFRDHGGVSRNHNTLDRKKTRLLEEGEIRDYIYRQLNLRNQSKENWLREKWFKLHSYRAAFSSELYEIRLPRKNRIALFLEFVIFKLK